MKYPLSVFAISLFAFAANATAFETLDAEAKQAVGAWQLEFTTPDDVKRTPIIVIGRQHEELVAWYIENEKPQEFKKVSVDDDTLSLTIRPKERPDVTITLEAKPNGDGACVGTGSFVSDSGDTGIWNFQGKRVKMSKFGDVERWSLSFVTPDQQQSTAVVSAMEKDGKLYGWYSSRDYELLATKLTKNGDSVVMSIATKTPDGASVDVTFRGTVSGNTVTGEADYDREGDTGSFPFRGERKS